MFYNVNSDQMLTLSDIYLEHLGERRGGFFVDVGANDGVHISNTHGLLDLGWRGVMVEASPAAYARLVANHKAEISSGQLVAENVCIGARDGEEIDFYTSSHNELMSTMMLRYHDICSTLYGIKYTPGRMTTTMLDTLLSRLRVEPGFDVFSLDIEGGELIAFAGFDIKRWRPQLAIIETHQEHDNPELAKKHEAVDAIMLAAGYRHVYANAVNTVYVATSKSEGGV